MAYLIFGIIPRYPMSVKHPMKHPKTKSPEYGWSYTPLLVGLSENFLFQIHCLISIIPFQWLFWGLIFVGETPSSVGSTPKYHINISCLWNSYTPWNIPMISHKISISSRKSHGINGIPPLNPHEVIRQITITRKDPIRLPVNRHSSFKSPSKSSWNHHAITIN
jgi:hypothetical protein